MQYRAYTRSSGHGEDYKGRVSCIRESIRNTQIHCIFVSLSLSLLPSLRNEYEVRFLPNSIVFSLCGMSHAKGINFIAQGEKNKYPFDTNS